ncbi:TetR/AcrR family transcriptional regulator [Amycolatopsis sp. SID8362]|uniref:TetR/AcrR family transcriptional regulator n=1 Tax=Amycolatopsis sp. SID8362 TaxID=2690346 RepID=UPI0013690C4A|nr:TetR/AcrR family transcriptional regulator [Amycolatopsis sp. SID8362]NBH03764.1 TetR family transcriptional regulator [Amycolatopsis sp. SID8362]NED40464.1 TetR/AcrR family transcriptional regulator [Amycolatopsis sp. SID8362]
MATTRKRRDAPRKGDLREQAILDTAEALLDREHVEPMTVETIAKGAGISRGSLYFYFGSKQEVLTALVARTVAVLGQDAASVDAGADPEETARASVRLTERMWRDHGPVMRAAVDLSPTVPEIARLWHDTVAAYAEAMTGVLLRAGLPTGDGPTGAAAVARALCWMTERVFYHASRSPGDLDAAAETCAELWRRTITTG